MNFWFRKKQERHPIPWDDQDAPRPTVNKKGEACFPEGIPEIPNCAFVGNKELRTAVLPDTVRRIRVRAFADCGNLKELVLNEGLERIDGNAFTGCTSLKSVVFPDSVQKVEAYAFFQSAFGRPVFSASGDVLYRLPEIPGQKKYIVPDSVKRIQAGAFLYQKELEEVILPEGLKYIHDRSFLDTGIRKLTLPASLEKVESLSFWGCSNLEEVVLLCDSKVVDTAAFYQCPDIRLTASGYNLDFEEKCRIQGRTILSVNPKLEIPRRNFWMDPIFVSLARRCASGDTDAMMAFAAYYDAMGKGEFYTSASNFWRYRAYLYGNQRAIQWRQDWLRDKPETLIPVVTNPHLSSTDGRKLRALGFKFFDPEREYTIGKKDENGVLEVSSWCGTEGPDEDGFGMEELYDFWFMDEFLNPIPGARKLSGWSGNSRRTSSEQFARYREQAAEILREMREKNREL